jgi:hypothetical protein
MSDLSYGELDRILRSLGFDLRGPMENNKIYWHPQVEALITLPIFPDDQAVYQHHIDLTRLTLDTYGLDNPFANTPRPQRAS